MKNPYHLAGIFCCEILIMKGVLIPLFDFILCYLDNFGIS